MRVFLSDRVRCTKIVQCIICCNFVAYKLADMMFVITSINLGASPKAKCYVYSNVYRFYFITHFIAVL